jgi:hypothetical protein
MSRNRTGRRAPATQGRQGGRLRAAPNTRLQLSVAFGARS